MNNEWSPREEILSASHRWPEIMAFGLAGILLGLVAAFFWPSYHQATRELYVGLNAYQLEGDEGVSGIANPQVAFVEDYKNWQMANLNSLVYMDKTLEETLSRLRSQDQYWESVVREQLEEILAVHWRNTGRWRLVAVHQNEVYAAQAVAAWGDVILESVHSAVGAAQDSMLLDLKIRAVLDAQARVIAQTTTHEGQLEAHMSWREQISTLATDQPLDDALRDQLWQASNHMEDSSPLSPEAFPPPGASAGAYLDWLDQGISSLNQVIEAGHAQIEALTKEVDALVPQYEAAAQESLGLSANLIVEDFRDGASHISDERPTGLWVFIGALLGLIAWAILWIAKITLRKGTPSGSMSEDNVKS